MPESPESWALVNQWRAGDDRAARELFDRYAEKLLNLARSRLNQRLAARVDAEDVVQSVFRTFFCRVREGQFTFENQDDLCKLLVRITVHKTLRRVKYHRAAKRNSRRETPQGEPEYDPMNDVLSREPSPEAAVTFIDQLEHFLNRLTKEERQILELRLQGAGTGEIAGKLGAYDRKIRRILERIRAVAELERLSLS